MRQRSQRGFTLIELMISVFILSILLSVSIAAFMRYMRRAKSAEAPISLSLIARSAKVYYLVDHPGADGTIRSRQFPASTAHPGFCCEFPSGRCPGSQNAHEAFSTNNTWRDLAFGVEDPHIFTYNFTAAGTRAVANAEVYMGECWTMPNYKSFAIVINGEDESVNSGTMIEDYSGAVVVAAAAN